MKRNFLQLILGLVFLVTLVSGFSINRELSGIDNENYPRKKTTLRVMSYNIHHANPPSKSGLIDIAAIVRTIKAQAPDLVALQEIDANTERSGEGNQAQLIADQLGMNVYFGKSIDFQGGDYGVAILSKYPVSEQTVHRLPTDMETNGERRVLASARVALPDGSFVRFGSTHLDAQKADVNRMLQIEEIIKISSEDNIPIILAGDFNATPNSDVIKILDKSFTRTCKDCGPTVPVIDPKRAIDFIAFKAKGKFKVISHSVIHETYASDHLPILAVLEY